MQLKRYTYTFNFITHILVHLVIVSTLKHSCTLNMSVKIKCIIIIDSIHIKCILTRSINSLCYSHYHGDEMVLVTKGSN